MIDTSRGNFPFIVALAFFDEHGANMQQMVTRAPTREHAAATAVAEYYANGGKYPFRLVSVMEIAENVARAAVELYDERRAEEQAEAAKVVGLRAVTTEEPA